MIDFGTWYFYRRWGLINVCWPRSVSLAISIQIHLTTTATNFKNFLSGAPTIGFKKNEIWYNLLTTVIWLYNILWALGFRILIHFRPQWHHSLQQNGNFFYEINRRTVHGTCRCTIDLPYHRAAILSYKFILVDCWAARVMRLHKLQ